MSENYHTAGEKNFMKYLLLKNNSNENKFTLFFKKNMSRLFCPEQFKINKGQLYLQFMAMMRKHMDRIKRTTCLRPRSGLCLAIAAKLSKKFWQENKFRILVDRESLLSNPRVSFIINMAYRKLTTKPPALNKKTGAKLSPL